MINETNPEPSPLKVTPAKSPEEFQNQLTVLQNDLAKLERIKPLASLAGTVVHDVRNCLGVISSTTQFVLQKLQPAEQERQAWEMVERNVQNIQKILKNYLNLARQVEGQKTVCSVNEIAERVAHFVEKSSAARTVKIELSLGENIPELFLDGPAIESALLNLANNAVEAIPGAGTVKLSSRLNHERQAVVVEVEDDGPGMPEEVKAKLFQPFFTTKRHGTGLGLFSAHTAIHNNGGILHCDSVPGQGTRMTVLLPIT